MNSTRNTSATDTNLRDIKQDKPESVMAVYYGIAKDIKLSIPYTSGGRVGAIDMVGFMHLIRNQGKDV